MAYKLKFLKKLMAKDNNNILVILIAIGLVIFLIGGGLGFFYQWQKNAPKIKEAGEFLEIKNTLSSELVPSMVAFGQVISISGRDITIASNNGKTLSVNINKDAPIYSYISAAAPNEQTRIDIDEIKKGNLLNITMKLNPDGSLSGQMVMVFSAGQVQ